MSDRVIRFKQPAWSVLVGEDKLALDGHGVPWITGKKKYAVAFAKELSQHFSAKCKPVKVMVLIETV